MNQSQQIEYNYEYEKLKLKFGEEKSELLSLIVKRDNMIYHQKFTIENEFFRLLGPEKVESAYLELQIRKLKITIDLIQMDINRNVIPNLQIIEQMVDREILEWDSKLLDLKAKLLGSLIIEGNVLSSEDTRELKSLYLELVNKIHPDLVIGFNDECEMLWKSVQHAFKNSDLNSLRCFSYLLKNQDLNFGSEYNDLKHEIHYIKQHINSLSYEIDLINNKYPFNLVEKISDPDWIANEKYRLQGHITEYLSEIDVLNYQLNKLKVIINGQLNQN